MAACSPIPGICLNPYPVDYCSQRYNLDVIQEVVQKRCIKKRCIKKRCTKKRCIKKRCIKKSCPKKSIKVFQKKYKSIYRLSKPLDQKNHPKSVFQILMHKHFFTYANRPYLLHTQYVLYSLGLTAAP